MKAHLFALLCALSGCAGGSPPRAVARAAVPPPVPSPSSSSGEAAPPEAAVSEWPLPAWHPNVDAMQATTALANEDAAAVSLATVDAAVVPVRFQISLERKACFGSCPVYKVTIDSAGARFTGTSPNEGCARRQVSATDIAKLVGLVNAIGFLRLKPQYTAQVTDHPWANVAVRMNGRTKVVEHYLADRYANGDKQDRANLRQLEAAIDEVSDAQRLATLKTLGACKGEGAYPTLP